MKVRSFKKKANGFYQVLLEETEPLLIHEDLILKYDILRSQKLEEETIKQIEKENKKYIVYQDALTSLKTRLRSTKELKERLTKKEYPNQEIEEVIKTLTKQGYLNDKIYAESYVHDKISFSKDGPEKIKEELKRKGIKIEDIEQALCCFTNELEQTRIKKIIDKENKTNRSKSEVVLKRKLLETLVRNGYHKETITPLLEEIKNKNENTIYQKEYEKQKKKLEKKYQGKELEYKLKEKMYQKGFHYENMDERP